jgi:hypothetical protein
VRGVRAVDGEQPRVVGKARADPAHARHRALGRPLLALVGPADLQVGRALREVGEVLLAPVDRVLKQPVPGQGELGPAPQRFALGLLLREQGLGIGRERSELAPRLRHGVLRSGDGDPHGGRAAARNLDVVTEPAARAAAERAVVALAGHRRRLLVGGTAATLAERAVVAGARLAGERPAIGAHDRRVGVVPHFPGQAPRVAEHQAALVIGGAVRGVVARVRLHPFEAPRVLRHELRVGVDHHFHGLLVLPRVGQLEPDESAAPAVGRDVGPPEPDAVDRRQVVADVAPAAREPRGGPHPLLVDAEVDRVEELERGSDDAAHLARDVPALCVEAPILETQHLGPRAGRHLATVLEPLAHGQLPRGRLRRSRGERRKRDSHSEGTLDSHVCSSPRTAAPGGDR